MFKLTALTRVFLGSNLLLCLLTSNVFTFAFVTDTAPNTKRPTAKTTGTSLSLSTDGNSMVSFSEVLFPTYLGAAFAVLSYKIDQDPQFLVEWAKEARAKPKTALEQVAMMASLGLATIPPVAALHTMATAGNVLSAATSTKATTTTASASKGLFASSSTKAAAAAKTTTAAKAATTAKVAVASKTSAVAATAAATAPTIAMSTIAVPISLGLATAFVSYQVDKDPEYAVKTLDAIVKLWRTKVMERDVTATTASTSTTTSGGTLAVGSAESAAVMQETSGTRAVGSTVPTAVGVQTEETVTLATASVTTTSTQEKKEEPATTPVQKGLRVMQSLWFPWLPMFIPPKGSKRHKAIKFAQALYFPWLPMFLPSKKEDEPVPAPQQQG